MDFETFNAFARELREISAGLRELRDAFVGRDIADAGGVVLGRVEDVLVSPREKIPECLVLRLARRPWQLQGDERLYPVRQLVRTDDGCLRASHTVAAVRRLLDFRPDFGPSDAVSLVEYLGAHDADG